MRTLPSDAVMDRKMFKIERNKAMPVGIDDWLTSFISIGLFSWTVKFAIFINWPIQGCIQDPLAYSTCSWALFSQ